MSTGNPATVLLHHDRWATQQLLDALASLTEQQLRQPFSMGLGTLQQTVVHIIGAMRGWGDLLAGREQRPRLELENPSVAELQALFDGAADELLELGLKHPAEELVTGSRAGKSYTFARGAVITHVTTHGMHHRAQALNMLRQLAVEPLPQSSVIEWILNGEPGIDNA